MADITINQLPQGTPTGSNILPYSNGTSTLGASVSAIFQNTNKIGINTTNTPSSLTVNGDIQLLEYGKLNFSNTPNTSFINSPQSNHLALYTSGSERIRINSLGYVGIGTNNPGQRLDVNGGISAVALSVQNILALNEPFPTTGSITEYTFNLINLSYYRALILSVFGYYTSNTNTALSISGPNGLCRISDNYANNQGATILGTISLVSGLISSQSQRTDQTSNDSTVQPDRFLRTHPYNQSSTSIKFYTASQSIYFRGGTFTIQGVI